MALWLVRAGGHGEYENKFLEEGRIYLTWHRIKQDLTPIGHKEGIQEVLQDIHPDFSIPKLRNHLGQVWTFLHRIEVGDWIVLPSKQKSAIHFGKVKSGCKFQADAEPPYLHYREVDWFATDIPRSNFDQDILHSLGAFMTICQIKRNDAALRIHAMAEKGWKSNPAHR